MLISSGETNTFGTPGVQEHALFMKNVSDAMVLRKMLFDQLEKASLPNVTEEQAKGMLHVAIVGGGPTGAIICKVSRSCNRTNKCDNSRCGIDSRAFRSISDSTERPVSRRRATDPYYSLRHGAAHPWCI